VLQLRSQIASRTILVEIGLLCSRTKKGEVNRIQAGARRESFAVSVNKTALWDICPQMSRGSIGRSKIKE